MSSSRPLVALAMLVATSAAADAATTTPEGARALEQGYAAYFSGAVVTKGIVAAKPDGDGYVVSWDLQKVAELAGAPAGAVKIAPLTYRLTPGDNDSWRLTADRFPRIVFNVETEKGKANGAFDFAGVKIDGLFDPRAVEFLRSRLDVDRTEGAVDLIDSSGAGHSRSAAPSHFKMTQEGIVTETRAKPSAGGGIDVALAHAIKNVKESISTPQDGDNPAIDMTYEIADVVAEATFTGLRAREIGEFWKYAVAHLDDAAPPREMKERARSALPLWNEIRGHSELHGLAVKTPLGEARMGTFGETLSLSGFTPTGAAAFGLEIKDLTVKSDLVPPWAQSLFPASLSFNVGASSDGWDKVAQIALDDAKFGEKGDLSPEAQAKIEQILIAGRPKLNLRLGHLTAPALDLTFEGEASAQASHPEGHIKLSADSLDRVVALVQEAAKDLPDAQGAVLGLTLVKGLAKTGADGRLVWDIEANADGKLTVNGQAMPSGD